MILTVKTKTVECCSHYIPLAIENGNFWNLCKQSV